MNDSRVNISKVRGKAYLEATEINKLFWERYDDKQVRITSTILELTDEFAAIKSTVEIFSLGGELDRCADGIKAAFKSDFDSYVEKAQTGSIKRAMEFLGVNLGSLDGDGESREQSVQNGWNSNRPSQPAPRPNQPPKDAANKASSEKIEHITALIRKAKMTTLQVDELLKKFSGVKELADLTAGQASALEHKLTEQSSR